MNPDYNPPTGMDEREIRTIAFGLQKELHSLTQNYANQRPDLIEYISKCDPKPERTIEDIDREELERMRYVYSLCRKYIIDPLPFSMFLYPLEETNMVLE